MRSGRFIACLAFLAVLTALALAGCGGDDEPSDAGSKPAPTETDTATTESTDSTGTDDSTETETESETKDGDSGGGTPAPEDEQGGAGDEEPARSQAIFTARRGRISPRVVRVPPYIAIRIELRSADGRTYALRVGRRRIVAGGQIAAASASFPGLRPGKALVGRSVGASNHVRVVANAEPGP